MSIQEALGHCCEGLKGIAISARDQGIKTGKWLGRTVVALSKHTLQAAKKVAQFAKPHFITLKNFLIVHKSYVLVAVLAAGLGAGIYALMRRICSSPSSDFQNNSPVKA